MQITLLDTENFTFKEIQRQRIILFTINKQTYILSLCELQSESKVIFFEHEGRTLTGLFLRYINLQYAAKLVQVLNRLGRHVLGGQVKYWFGLFEVGEVDVKGRNLYIQDGVYGGQINIGSSKAIISNVFKHKNYLFYFLSSKTIMKPESCSPIIIQQQVALVGFYLMIQQTQVCIPFRIIFSNQPCTLIINPSISYFLQKTCYLFFMDNYCTGIRISPNIIIATKHLLPIQQQIIGCKLEVRIYPYRLKTQGVVVKVSKNADLMKIQLKQLNQLSQTNQTQLSVRKDNKNESQLRIGKQIFAIGFGKFAFSPQTFLKFQLVLPTVEVGIVSKIIKLYHIQVFIKTDAALYNGCSGSGIWSEAGLQAMAVFILKNKTNGENYNRHNFSYIYTFLTSILTDKIKDGSPFFQKLQQFNQINTRSHINLIHHYMPKL